MAISRFKKFILVDLKMNHVCLVEIKNLNLSRSALTKKKHLSCPAPLPSDSLPTLKFLKKKESVEVLLSATSSTCRCRCWCRKSCTQIKNFPPRNAQVVIFCTWCFIWHVSNAKRLENVSFFIIKNLFSGQNLFLQSRTTSCTFVPHTKSRFMFAACTRPQRICSFCTVYTELHSETVRSVMQGTRDKMWCYSKM